MNRGIGTLLALLLLAIGLLPAAAQDASPEGESLLAGLGYPELVITTDGVDFTVPAEVEAGRYRLVLENTGPLSSELLLSQVPAGMTDAEVQAALEEAEQAEVPPPLVYELVINGGTQAEPGATGEVVLDLAAGDWVFNLAGFGEEDDEGINLFKVVTVTGEPPAVEDPAAAVEVSLIDFDFEIADTVPAGPQIWKVTGAGEQPHHMVVASIPDGSTEQQVIDLINAFFGMPATPEAGATPIAFEDFSEVAFSGILSNGQTNWLEFDLAPGTYTAICFIPDPEGTPHVMLGMVEVFTVA
jgi:hypothetical protein